MNREDQIYDGFYVLADSTPIELSDIAELKLDEIAKQASEVEPKEIERLHKPIDDGDSETDMA